MCGIAGFYAPHGIAEHFIQDMTDLIAHRGPNDEGHAIWTSLADQKPSFEVQTQPAIFALGHRRLSILDLSPLGHQPMAYQNNRYWLSYNGEIYNYIELREELSGLGYVFQSDTDSEVILAAYAEWGAACQNKFNGMWAFALYDAQEHSLFLSRDRFGIKPLYYWVGPDGALYFGSEIKQFTPLQGWQPILNHARAYDFLVWGVTDHTDETLFDGVFQLRPGHCAAFALDCSEFLAGERIETRAWYELPTQTRDISFANASEELGRLLKDAVRLRLRADVGVGSCLSGGVDSSSIVCLMNQILKDNNAEDLQKTFSALSRVEDVNEQKWIDIVSAHTQVDAYSVYPELDALFDSLGDMTWHQDEPFGSTSIYAQWNVFALAAEHDVTVMLDGQGADEQLAGYSSFFGARLADLFKSGRWISMGREAMILRKVHGYGWGWIIAQFADSLLPTFVRLKLRKLIGRADGAPAWLNNELLDVRPAPPHKNSKKTVASLSRAQMTNTNLQMLLHWEDRDSMAHSIEARVPFLDYRLVEHVIRLPSDYKIADGVTKRVLREAMGGILPEQIQSRVDKIGFATPEETWLKEGNAQVFRERIQDAIENTQGLITADALTYFEDVLQGRKPFDFQVWRIISFTDWMRVFKVSVR